MSLAEPSAPLASSDTAQDERLPVGRAELAAYIAGKLCHDFISPAGAIMSGLDLLEDPSAQDMRDDALGLIRQSARKMVAHVHFARVAFGAATSSEAFTSAQLKTLITDMAEGGRATLDWRIEDQVVFTKTQARILINLAWMTLSSLAMGGTAVLTSRFENDTCLILGSAEGPRARLKPEALIGLKGLTLSEGLHGQWIQPYWLWLAVDEARGELKIAAEDGRVGLMARLPV